MRRKIRNDDEFQCTETLRHSCTPFKGWKRYVYNDKWERTEVLFFRTHFNAM